MDKTELGLGGGYVYQWDCAILLAINYLLDNPKAYNSVLHKLVSSFLSGVDRICLEEHEETSSDELEDINLLSGDRKICIQVKAKESEGERWTLGDKTLRKAFFRFYCNAALAEEDPLVRFVFLSNRAFNRDLVRLRESIDAGTTSQSDEASSLFEYLKGYAKENGCDWQLERERFSRFLNHLTFMEFLAIDEITPVIEERLGAQGVRDTKRAYQSLFTEFAKRSTRTGSRMISRSDLLDIVPDLFTGRLIYSLRIESLRSAAQFLLRRAQCAVLPPLGATSGVIITRIEAIIENTDNALNDYETFILLGATCLPFILRTYGIAFSASDSLRQIQRLCEKIDEDPYAPEGTRDIIIELAPAIATVADARSGFDLSSNEFCDTQIRSARIRMRLLSVLLHLSVCLNLDQFISPSPPASIEAATWRERFHWWRQAYIHGVCLRDQRLQLFFQLPQERLEDYSSILVDPVDEEIRALIDHCDEVLHSANINLKYLDPIVTQGDVPIIPDAEWSRLKQEVRIAQARKVGDRLHQKIVETQYLRELLVGAEMSQAEQMSNEGKHAEAARSFAKAAELLARNREAAQARHCAVKAAEQYLKANQPSQAARQFICAAEVWLNNARTPQLVSDHLQKAGKIATELADPVLQMEVLLAKAWEGFATIRDHYVENVLKQASQLVLQIPQEEKRDELSAKRAIQHAVCAIIWQETDAAQQILIEALSSLGKPALRLDLMQTLIIACTENEDWDNVDGVYAEAQEALNDLNDPERRGLLTMHYGASLARRGRLEDAHRAFSSAIQQLDGQSGAYTLGLAYQNMQYMLISSGEFFSGFGQLETRRIDLFHRTQSENRGYSYHQQALVDLGKRNYRDALQNIRLAHKHYWSEGAWAGIDQTFEALARLNASTDDFPGAVRAAVRAGDEQLTEQYSAIVRDTVQRDQTSQIVDYLTKPRSAVREQRAAAIAVGILSDVIPPPQLEQVIDCLLDLLTTQARNTVHEDVRRQSAKSMGQLVPQFNAEQTNRVVQQAIDLLALPQYWTVAEELLKMLDRCFRLRECRVDQSLYSPVADTLLGFKGAEHLHKVNEDVAIHMARTAPPEVRSRVVDHLKQSADQFRYLSLLASLGEPVPNGLLVNSIGSILSSINPRPAVAVKDGKQSTIIGIGGFQPRALNNFNNVLTQSLADRVIDGLLEAIINEHNHFGNRSGAIWALSDLPQEMLIKRADEIADYLLWGAEGTLPRSSIVDFELRSQIDPFSDFRIDMGNIEQARRSSLQALGSLYAHVSPEHQHSIGETLITSSRDPNPTVRQGVAMALNCCATGAVLPTRFILALVVLLHDPDPAPCSSACAACGRLVARGLAQEFSDDLVERLVNLAETAQSVEVRVGAAVGLQMLARADDLAQVEKKRVTLALENLSSDISCRVRMEASGPQVEPSITSKSSSDD